MGDRIAVMNLGVLQQIGAPRALYTNPANTFVARFKGSPAMNLLPAGALGSGIGDADKLVGFRPETRRLSNGKRTAHFDAIIEVVQYLGDEQLAYPRLGEAEIVAKLPIETALEVGRQATLQSRSGSSSLRCRERRRGPPTEESSRSPRWRGSRRKRKDSLGDARSPGSRAYGVVRSPPPRGAGPGYGSMRRPGGSTRRCSGSVRRRGSTERGDACGCARRCGGSRGPIPP